MLFPANDGGMGDVADIILSPTDLEWTWQKVRADLLKKPD
jgi:hypothetical protein